MIFRQPLPTKDLLANSNAALASLPGKRGPRTMADYAEADQFNPAPSGIFSPQEEEIDAETGAAGLAAFTPQAPKRPMLKQRLLPMVQEPEGLEAFAPQRPKDLASVMARAGTPAARDEMRRAGTEARPTSPMDELRRRVLAGDTNAQQAMLNAAGGNASLAFSTVYGRTPHEAALAGEAEDTRRFEANLGERQADRSEGGRRFDVTAQQEAAQHEATIKYKNTMAVIQEKLRNREIDVQQAKVAEESARAQMAHELDQKKLALAETDPNRRITGAKAGALEDYMSGKMPLDDVSARLLGMPTADELAHQKTERDLGVRLKKAQVTQAEREITGGDQRKAAQEAQALVDQGLDPQEALSRVTAKYGLSPEEVAAPQFSQDPLAAKQRLARLGFMDEKSAYKAALDRVVAGDRDQASLMGKKLRDSEDNWTFQASPASDNAYRQAKKAEVVRALIEDGVPGPDAARIANKFTQRY